ncbi:MAG TPA: BamA/TamA family outer membrane protein, partial [Rhodanobacteraceae bacterium]|nr:BamA/TamA family outer membrane protein [Rhodanobacteraceae bacterium]
MPRFVRTILLAAMAFCVEASAQSAGDAPAQAASPPAPTSDDGSFLDTFRDSDDRQFDLSNYLLEHKGGFLLVPIIITEPAVGNGGGAGALFFDQPMQSDESKDRGERLPPNIYGALAFKTSNGSYGGGIGGSFHFDDDRWRYLGGLMKMSMNLDFYTTDPLGQAHKIGYNIDGIASMQEGAYRIADKTYLSARWVYIDVVNRFNRESDSAFFTSKELAERASGAGIGIEHDTRDNTLSPTEGTLAKAIATFYTPAIGSDDRFETYRANAFGYFPFAERWTIG